MRKTTLFKCMAPTLVLFSAQAVALPFQSLDPRSYSMGGVGVASGTSANAGFMNPALLAAAQEEEDFSLEIPVVGGRFMDRDEVIDEIDTYQENNYEANLTAAIEAYKASPADNALAANVATAADALWTQLNKLSNKAVQGEFAGGLVVGIPSKRFGVSLTANAWAVGGGLLEVTPNDDTLISGIIADGNAGAATLATNLAIQEQVAGTEDVVNKLTSNLQARGAVFQEVSLAIAREFDIAGSNVAIGVTPKYVKVTTFDYAVDVNTADFETDQGKKEYTDFNFDLGVAKDYGNGWKTGLVVKNAIGQDYQTVLGNTIKVEPQGRIGVSHKTDWTLVAIDIDLNESESLGFDSKTQYAGIGAELDIFDTAQIRVGYRHNMSDSDTSIVTAGLGFTLFGAHFDVGVGANEDEIGGSFQMGIGF